MARRRYSDAERAERAAANAALTEAADEALAAPDAGQRLVAVALRAPTLARISLRNLMLLMMQAEARGIELRDVETYRGWQARGRQVQRGAVAMSMVAPMLRRDQADTEEATPAPEAHQEETATPRRGRFRLQAKWFDISQTDPADADGDEATEETTQDQQAAPVDLVPDVFTTLQTQAGRLGYEVAVWPHSEPHSAPVAAAPETGTIHVYQPPRDGDRVPVLELLAAEVARLTVARGTAAKARHATTD